jgi:hypothetical protein
VTNGAPAAYVLPMRSALVLVSFALALTACGGGCAFSINAEWKGSSIRWDELPMIGDWSAQQQKAAPDNAAVDTHGLVSGR